MTEFNRVFLDTAPLIYFLDDDANFGKKTKSIACGVDLIPISLEIAKLAAKIKAEYKDFKTMDSLQLATAVHTGCDLFLTNDKQLRRFDGLFCTTVEDWIL